MYWHQSLHLTHAIVICGKMCPLVMYEYNNTIRNYDVIYMMSQLTLVLGSCCFDKVL